MQAPDPCGKSVIITAGEFAGEEGVCLGRAEGTDGLWAVSPVTSNRILNLRLEEEFGILINPGAIPGRN